MTTIVDRGDAVKSIAGHLADRDSYVITAPPSTLATLSQTLRDVPDWTAYLDGGTPAVLHTGLAGALAVVDILTLSAAVIVVPKTVPPSALSTAVGQEIPTDGSQDIVILMAPDEPVMFPLLFVDALAIVDPHAAAQLYANQTSNLS